MTKKIKDFDQLLLKELENPKVAAAYLNEQLAYRGPRRQEIILEALRQIVAARGMTRSAKQTGISRRTLYQAFSARGNPTITTFLALIDTIGLQLRFDAKKAAV